MDNELPNWVPITIIALVIGAWIWWKFKDDFTFSRKGIITTGRITNWMSMTDSGKKYFYPIIEYRTKDGKTITYRAEERCEGEPMYDVGTEVEVKYLESDSKKVKTSYPD